MVSEASYFELAFNMVAEPNDPPDVAATAGGELGAAVQEEIEIPVAQTPPTLEERVVILEQQYWQMMQEACKMQRR